MKLRIAALAIALALTLTLCGCMGRIADEPLSTGDIAETVMPQPGETLYTGELYGSYLTMNFAHTPDDVLGLPYIRVFNSYSDVENYYDSTVGSFSYGRRFTLAMNSFTDEFLATTDVMILAIDEPSSYVSHTADPIEISDDGVIIRLQRHIPENAPQHQTLYHLIFTAPKGSFSTAADKPLDVEITDVVYSESNSAYYAESFQLSYPEFVSGSNFCYRAEPLNDNPQLVIDAIDGYNELVHFYDSHKADYNLEESFGEYVGTLYNWEICERYIIIATLIPCATDKMPETKELFVNNLELYISIDADLPGPGEQPATCYLLLTAVERNELSGVNLDFFNLSWE